MRNTALHFTTIVASTLLFGISACSSSSSDGGGGGAPDGAAEAANPGDDASGLPTDSGDDGGNNPGIDGSDAADDSDLPKGCPKTWMASLCGAFCAPAGLTCIYRGPAAIVEHQLVCTADADASGIGGHYKCGP